MKHASPEVTTTRRALVGAFALPVLAVLALAGLVFYFAEINSEENADRDAVIAAQRKDIDNQNRSLQEANKRLENAGEPTVAVPSAASTTLPVGGASGVPGPVGPAPTEAQIVAAVQTYCTRYSCEGADGKDGAQGSQGPQGEPGVVTDAQVAAAVVSYCSQGSCATGPTDTQVVTAVSAFCAENGCQGPEGDKGDTGEKGDTGDKGADGKDGADGADGIDGKDGSDGRGITAVTCTAEGRLQITYSDETTVDVGLCTPLPEETTAPPEPTTTAGTR